LADGKENEMKVRLLHAVIQGSAYLLVAYSYISALHSAL
jgi:hypothetical protein